MLAVYFSLADEIAATCKRSENEREAESELRLKSAVSIVLAVMAYYRHGDNEGAWPLSQRRVHRVQDYDKRIS